MVPNIMRIVATVNLDHWHTLEYNQAQAWLEAEFDRIYKPQYEPDERIVFVQQQGDIYVQGETVGLIIKNLQVIANEKDISNFFIVLQSANPDLTEEVQYVTTISRDPVPITAVYTENPAWQRYTIEHHPASDKEVYQYGSANPLKVNLNDLNTRDQYLLSESRRFCMYPWIHLHAWPTGQAFPCCMSEYTGEVGNAREQPLKQIWNGAPMRDLRRNMLAEQPSPACTRCYEQEEAGFFSGRQSANKHHGHHIDRVAETQVDGTVDRFEMTYWDIRFSNLCNLSCRSCGHIFSSSWYQDQARLAGTAWADKHTVLNYAGRTSTDMWEQLLPHLDYVEQIYFAGGEPLMMAEHYNILDELERRGRFDVRLIYNTNFTHVKLKDRTVFDYWKRFKSVAVGASLDAMGARAEYIRKGTKWDTVERNREQMLTVCPNVDFYISPTLSIMNALHLPDFHRTWVDQGYIRAQDLNVNVLQDPTHYRVDIAPIKYKQQVRVLYEEHLEWLRPLDLLRRATVGFESAINFMMATDNTALLPRFWSKTQELDAIRGESILEVIPELEHIKL
jgi:organic radical activating enzyme